MKKNKGKTPSLITGSSGRPKESVAERTRACARCSSNISSGEKCFEVPKVGGAYANHKTFCTGCFNDILAQTRIDLEYFENLLS